MKRFRWLPASDVVAITVALSAGSCVSGSNGTPGNASGKDGGTAPDATASCTTDAQCAETVPQTTPASCATGRCNAAHGVCEYEAKDEDGDGHAAADCKSNSGVAIQDGDDCNDHDPSLFPGHPESCTGRPDGGAPDAGFCTPGQISCLPDGTESACTGSCTPCKPSATQCSGDGALETCGSNGQWAAAVACTNQTCVSGACAGVCGPGQVNCDGLQPQTCAGSGQWQNEGAACSGTTAFCVDAGCTAPPPSCAPGGPGMNDCGASGESCCTSPEVRGGTYFRTYANSGSGPTGKANPATVSGLRLDKYLVTVGRFRQFVSAWNSGAGYLPPGGAGKHTHLHGGNGLSATGGGYEPGWATSDNGSVSPTSSNLSCDAGYSTWTDSAGIGENLPINCLNWWESYAFCIWDGGFLPSESEWEFASAGGSQQREYPWGTTAPGLGNQHAIYGCDYPSGSGTCTGTVNMAPVGTAILGAALWGQLDLTGSVWEWNLDWYAAYVDPCVDCANLTTAPTRAFRGGSFFGDTSDLLPPNRYNYSPSNRTFDVGFRCARTP